jgi:hypothetical protein
MARNDPNPISFGPSQFSVPNQSGTSPNANDARADSSISGPIPGIGGGGIGQAPPLQPAPPPLLPASRPAMPTLAPYRPGVGTRILSGLGSAFLGPQMVREIPGSTLYERAQRAHGLGEPEPGGQRTGATPQPTQGQTGRGRLSRIASLIGGFE